MHSTLSYLNYSDVLELIFCIFSWLLILAHVPIAQTILSPLTGLITFSLAKYPGASFYDTASMALQCNIEEISVTMRKRLEMEAKSYPKEEQEFFQLSLPFDFKIQCNQYHKSLKSERQFLVK